MHTARNTIVAAVLLASAFFSTAVSAAPQNGFGVYVGVVGAAEDGLVSRGLSLGMDAQFVGSERWSFNPYLMLSGEKREDSKYLSDGLVGLQVRRWFGEWFLGGQVFAHDRLIFGNGTVQVSSYGPAVGAVAGVEYASGWGAEVQADLFEALNAAVQRNAIRMHMTYRWH